MKNLIQITLLTFGFLFAFNMAAIAQNTLDEGGVGEDINMFLEDENLGDEETLDDQIRLTVYPSPAQGDYINIKYDNLIAQSTVTVYDADGREIYNEKVGNERDNNGSISVAINNLSSGFYIVKLVSGHLESMQKILIHK